MTSDKPAPSVPREWWIKPGEFASIAEPGETRSWQGIHVIERSAYDLLKQERDFAREVAVGYQGNMDLLTVRAEKLSLDREHLQKCVNEAHEKIDRLTLELAAYKNQRPEDFLTPYENELLGDLELVRKELAAARRLAPLV